MSSYLRVTYVKSSIGRLQRQKDTIRALGLRRLGQTVEIPDNPTSRGLVNAVAHLVRVEEVQRESEAGPQSAAPAPSGGSR